MKMNKSYIDQLLQKYLDAESSLKEEQVLQEYFANGDYPSEHAPYADMFMFFSEAKSKCLEKEITVDPHQKESTNGFAGRIINMISPKVMGIAASLLILISVGFFFNNEPSYVGKTTEITDEEEALRMTKEALAYLSIKLDKNSRTISTNVSKMEKVSIIK